MSYPDEIRIPPGILRRSAVAALVCELVLLTLAGWHQHWLAHPQKTTGLDASKFIEAQVLELPPEVPKLMEEKKIPAPARKEATLSKVPSQGKKPSPDQQANALPQQNVTQSGTTMAPTHGPVAVYAPKPAIPSYLQEQQLKTSVVIDFFITAQGAVTPRLVGSSGNEELDAIAIATARKWQFRAAEKDHKPVDSKVRLRILFEVQ